MHIPIILKPNLAGSRYETQARSQAYPFNPDMPYESVE